MWADLGIDLNRHDMLLNALGPIYKDVYLSQKNRPRGMGFFDFVVGDIHGIRVQELRKGLGFAQRLCVNSVGVQHCNWTSLSGAGQFD
jgi:hypothetical protein